MPLALLMLSYIVTKRKECGDYETIWNTLSHGIGWIDGIVGKRGVGTLRIMSGRQAGQGRVQGWSLRYEDRSVQDGGYG